MYASGIKAQPSSPGNMWPSQSDLTIDPGLQLVQQALQDQPTDNGHNSEANTGILPYPFFTWEMKEAASRRNAERTAALHGAAVDDYNEDVAESPFGTRSVPDFDRSNTHVYEVPGSNVGQWSADFNDDLRPASDMFDAAQPLTQSWPFDEDSTPALNSPYVSNSRRRVSRSGPGRKKRIGAKGERFEKDFTVATDRLRFTSIQPARLRVQARTPLGLGQDDFAEVEACHQNYIKLMMMTFDQAELASPPETRSRTEAELTYFRNWQTDQHNAVVIKIEDKKDSPSFVEERCWDVYLAVIDMHRHGAPPGSEDRPRMLHCPCSTRMMTIIDAMRGFTIVRLDILRRDRIDQLVHNPLAFVERKLTNVWVNQKKQVKLRSTGGAKTKKRKRSADSDE